MHLFKRSCGERPSLELSGLGCSVTFVRVTSELRNSFERSQCRSPGPIKGLKPKTLKTKIYEILHTPENHTAPEPPSKN